MSGPFVRFADRLRESPVAPVILPVPLYWSLTLFGIAYLTASATVGGRTGTWARPGLGLTGTPWYLPGTGQVIPPPPPPAGPATAELRVWQGDTLILTHAVEEVFTYAYEYPFDWTAAEVAAVTDWSAIRYELWVEGEGVCHILNAILNT